MAYEPTIWKNREVERPRTFRKQENPDGTITLIPAEGNIIEQGTPIIADTMNNLEQGVKQAHDLTDGIGDLETAFVEHLADDVRHVTAEISKFKRGSSTYTNRGTSQTFTDSFCTANSLVTIVITSGTPPQGVWTVNSANGSFTITSTVAETTNITFDYYIQKAVG